MAKLELTPVTSLGNPSILAAINANSDAIEAALENTLSRDGTLPNQMEADFDMNSNDILNGGTIHADTVILNGEQLLPSAVAAQMFLQAGTGAVQRTMQEKAREPVSVKDFGAVGDGVTVDNAAFQSAINHAASVGAEALVNDGDYLLDCINNPVTLGDGAHLRLMPGAIIRAKSNAAATLYGVVTITGSNVSVRGGTIIGDRGGHDYSSGGTHEQSGCILINNETANISNILIDGVRMVDGTGDGVLLTGRNSGGAYYGPSDVTISNCLIEDCRRQGISVVLGYNTMIVNNTIRNIGVTKYAVAGTAPMSGIDVEGGSSPRHTLIEGNTFEGCVGGSVILYNANGARVVGNFMSGAGVQFQFSANVLIANNIIRADAVSGAQGIEQNTGAAVVSTSGKMLGIGLKYRIVARATIDFTTVGAADNNVGTEFIATGFGPIGAGDQVQQVVENVLICGNFIYGGAGGISSSGFTRNVLITGNHLYGQGTRGIYVGSQGAAAGIVGGEKVIGNAIFNQSIGIQSAGPSCTLAGNFLDTTSNRSIYASATSVGGVVKGNEVRAHGNAINAAIDLGGTGAWDVTDNHVRMNHPTVTGNYAVFTSAAGCKVVNNTVTGVCGTAAIRTSQKAQIIGNRIVGVDSPDGIYCSSSNGSNSIVSSNYVESVRASGSRYGIRFSGGGAGVRIIRNDVLNSASTFTQAIDTSANTTSVIALNSTSGGAINSNGTDTLSGNVAL